MGINRQAYYKCNRADAARLAIYQKVADFVQEKRQRQPRLGERKLYYLLRCQPQLELQVGRDRLFSILRERRLLVTRKRAYHRRPTATIALTSVPSWALPHAARPLTYARK